MVPYLQSSPKSWWIKTVKFHSPGEKRAGRWFAATMTVHCLPFDILSSYPPKECMLPDWLTGLGVYNLFPSLDHISQTQWLVNIHWEKKNSWKKYMESVYLATK